MSASMDACLSTEPLYEFRGVPEQSVRKSSKSLLYYRFYKHFAPIAGLSIPELQSLLANEGAAWSCGAGKVVLSQGDLVTKPKVVLSGWACSQQILEDGHRQIFSFVLPGDFLGFDQITRPLPANIVALSPMVLGDVPDLLRAARVPDRFPQLAHVLRAMEQRQMASLYSHIRRLGSQTAYERLHDLLRELADRLLRAGLAFGGSVPFPLTQEVLGDALGLSSVHVNRTMQQMRRDGVLELERGRMRFAGPRETMAKNGHGPNKAQSESLFVRIK